MERGPAREAVAAGQQAGTHGGGAESGSRAKKLAETARAQDSKALSPGLEFPRYFTLAGVDPFDEVEWEIRSAIIGNEKGKVVFEQRDVEIPKTWSQQATNIVVSKYFRGQIGAPERERSVRQLIGRVVDTITGWARAQKYFASEEALQSFSRRAEAPARLSEGGLQQPGVVQLRLREGAAVLGLLHQLGAGHHGFDPHAGEDRGHAVQVRLGHRQQPVGDPLLAGAAGRWRHGVRPGVVHEGLRRVCRRHQVGRQDPARREDGHPQRRAPGHRGVHQLQGRGREEGVGAHRRRLRRLVHGHGVHVGLLPELEQQRARHRRFHARGAGRRRLDDEVGAGRLAGADATRRAT